MYFILERNSSYNMLLKASEMFLVPFSSFAMGNIEKFRRIDWDLICVFKTLELMQIVHM